jgi:hypothetical protein
MAVITLAADSTTLVLNGFAFTSFVSGDILELAPVNDLTSRVNSSSGGVNIQGRSDGGVHDLTIRVQRYSDDDIFLNSAINQAVPVVFDGSLKENFVKDGTDGVESWILENGSITTRPSAPKNDQDGNALMEYVLQFRIATRNI